MRARSIGHYILGKTIGEGTFGKVKLGTHILTGEKVAIKILEKERIVDVADVERVAREIHILKLIRNPHIIQLYEIIETPRQLYLIMEYAAGGELFDHIVASARVEESQACRFFHQIIAGVEKIHEMNVVHRDLKPENLLLDEQQNIKIVDFGLSNTYAESQLLKTACGSPCYAAPEMIAGKHYVPSCCDVWSCGVILFALVCGYLPFEDQNTACLYKKILSGDYQAPKFISVLVKDLIQGMLTTDPARRMTIDQIRQHPWFMRQTTVATQPSHRGGRGKTSRFPSCEVASCERCMNWWHLERSGPDGEVLAQLEQFGFHKDYAIKCLEMNKHNHVTTSYYLLMEKRHRHRSRTQMQQLRLAYHPEDYGLVNDRETPKAVVQTPNGQVASPRLAIPLNVASPSPKGATKNVLPTPKWNNSPHDTGERLSPHSPEAANPLPTNAAHASPPAPRPDRSPQLHSPNEVARSTSVDFNGYSTARRNSQSAAPNQSPTNIDPHLQVGPGPALQQAVLSPEVVGNRGAKRTHDNGIVEHSETPHKPATNGDGSFSFSTIDCPPLLLAPNPSGDSTRPAAVHHMPDAPNGSPYAAPNQYPEEQIVEVGLVTPPAPVRKRNVMSGAPASTTPKQPKVASKHPVVTPSKPASQVLRQSSLRNGQVAANMRTPRTATKPTVALTPPQTTYSASRSGITPKVVSTAKSGVQSSYRGPITARQGAQTTRTIVSKGTNGRQVEGPMTARNMASSAASSAQPEAKNSLVLSFSSLRQPNAIMQDLQKTLQTQRITSKMDGSRVVCIKGGMKMTIAALDLKEYTVTQSYIRRVAYEY
eukprot:Platyproteum_vivax@DN7388_c0_g1_i3.p1